VRLSTEKAVLTSSVLMMLKLYLCRHNAITGKARRKQEKDMGATARCKHNTSSSTPRILHTRTSPCKSWHTTDHTRSN